MDWALVIRKLGKVACWWGEASALPWFVEIGTYVKLEGLVPRLVSGVGLHEEIPRSVLITLILRWKLRPARQPLTVLFVINMFSSSRHEWSTGEGKRCLLFRLFSISGSYVILHMTKNDVLQLAMQSKININIGSNPIAMLNIIQIVVGLWLSQAHELMWSKEVTNYKKCQKNTMGDGLAIPESSFSKAAKFCYLHIEVPTQKKS